MQYEYRRVGGCFVQLVQRRHSLLRKLELRPAAHHPHPLWRGSTISLCLKHSQRIRQRRYALPTQLQIEVQSASNQMEVGVVESGNRSAFFQINDLSGAASRGHDFFITANRDKFSVLDSHSTGCGFLAVNGMKAAIYHDQIGVHCASLSNQY